MAREDVQKLIRGAKEIHPAPEEGNGLDKTKKYSDLAGKIAELAMCKLVDPVKYQVDLADNLKELGMGVRRLEALIAPAYRKLARAKRDSEPDEERPGQRDEVEQIGQACELFCDADDGVYATVTLAGHRETWPVSSRRFRRYVLSEYRRRHGRLAAGTALVEGIDGIAATASDGPVCEVFVRLGSAGDKVYLDLCRADWKVVEIGADGWRILDTSPVPFLRPAGLHPLPLPSRDGVGIGHLRPLVNIPDDQEWKLYVLWLVGCFRPKGPYPILIVNGEQGSIKTGTIKLARRLVDPAKVEVAKPPKSEDDLIIAAKSQWLAAYDNLSSMDEDLADGLCRLATGAGLQTRKLYTDDEQSLIQACRSVALNGIPDIASRGDLADRAVVLTALAIADEARREEAEIDQTFTAAAPAILAALLDGVVAGLKGRAAAAAATRRKPRMADFAVFSYAAASAFGWTGEEFLEAYEANRMTRVERVVEADPVAEAILRLVIRGRSGERDELAARGKAVVGLLGRYRDEAPPGARGGGIGRNPAAEKVAEGSRRIVKPAHPCRARPATARNRRRQRQVGRAKN
jgi:hypothetical protein